jgi:hypothetical protein
LDSLLAFMIPLIALFLFASRARVPSRAKTNRCVIDIRLVRPMIEIFFFEKTSNRQIK